MMQILRAKKFKMKTSMSKKKRLGSELERKEAMEKYLEVKFAEEELQKELDEAKSDSDSEVKYRVLTIEWNVKSNPRWTGEGVNWILPSVLIIY